MTSRLAMGIQLVPVQGYAMYPPSVPGGSQIPRTRGYRYIFSIGCTTVPPAPRLYPLGAWAPNAVSRRRVIVDPNSIKPSITPHVGAANRPDRVSRALAVLENTRDHETLRDGMKPPVRSHSAPSDTMALAENIALAPVSSRMQAAT